MNTVKPVLVATSIKQATCIKQACVQFPKQANTLKCTCIKQAYFDCPLSACLIQVGLYWLIYDAFFFTVHYAKVEFPQNITVINGKGNS